MAKSEKRADQLQPSAYCLFIFLFIYAQRLLKPNNLPKRRLPKPRDLPETENAWNRFIYTQHLLKPKNFFEWRLPKPRNLPETENKVVRLQLNSQL